MKPRPEYVLLLRAFSDLSLKAYATWHLAASPPLAKMGLAKLFHEYAMGKDCCRIGKLFFLRKLQQYYLNALIQFSLWLSYKIAHTFSRQRTAIRAVPTVFIDSYLVLPNVILGADILDNYLPGIQKPLTDAGWHHVLLPRCCGTQSPWQYYRAFVMLRRTAAPVVSEFQLLSWVDYFLLVNHLIVYPWLLLALCRHIPRSREGCYLRVALYNGLADAGNLYGAVRYFAARRLARLLPSHARCLQWYENQTFERCFNRGLREAGVSMPVYGAQLFIWPPELINNFEDETECRSYKPDVILVNGPHFEQYAGIPCILGPSLRYSKLFATQTKPEKERNVLVLLPYFEEAARSIIDLVVQCWSPESLLIKFHPASHFLHLREMISAVGRVVEGDLYDLFKTVGLLIGAASGSLVEAAVVGIPVIVVRREGELNYSYLSSEIGKGLLWETATNVEQVNEAKKQLLYALANRQEERRAAMDNLRREFFSQTEPNAIVKALELNGFGPE